MSTNKMDFSQRNVAIDILRALTMLVMIFVNDFWTIKEVPKWMQHARGNEDFLGLADTIFPIFLFMVGMSIPFAIERRYSKGFSDVSTLGHILARSFALLMLGVFTESFDALGRIGMSSHVYRTVAIVALFMVWNVYPKTDKKTLRHVFTALQIIGILILVYLAFIFRTRNDGYLTAGYWGILGLIGWTYLVCVIAYLFTRDNVMKVFWVWLVFVVLCAIKSGSYIPREANIINDLLNATHLGTPGHNALTMGGALFSLMIVKYSSVETRKKVLFLVGAVVALLIASRVTNLFWIMSKNRATLPCVFACMGIAIGFYGLIQWAVSKGGAKWFNIIKAGGTATLSCYVIAYLVYAVFWGYLNFSLPVWMKTGTYGLIKSVLFAFLCIGVTALLEKCKIKLKI